MDTLVGFLIVALATILVATSLRLRQVPSFRLVLVNRWVRWLLFGFGIAFLAREWEISVRPYWALAPGFLLIWILIESVYTWLAVKALSLSDMPIYPRYRPSLDEVAWPVLPYFVRAKEEIRELGLSLDSSLSAELGNGLSLRSMLYFSEDRTTRLQVIFTPRASGSPALFLVFSSHAGDQRWVTDNVWLPFGGLFPDDWSVSRHPFQQSTKGLFARHVANLKRWNAEPMPFGGEAVEQLNEEQERLDLASTAGGILFPKRERPEFGKLTGDGRYRVWKQILLLNYLGKVGNRTAG